MLNSNGIYIVYLYTGGLKTKQIRAPTYLKTTQFLKMTLFGRPVYFFSGWKKSHSNIDI